MRLSTDARCVLLLIFLACCPWATRLRGPIDLRWDGAVYYVLGTSLAEGKGYRLLNEPGEIRAIQYPPLVPALVAAHQRLLGTVDPDRVGRRLRATYALIYGLYVVSAYALARRLAGPLDATLVAAIAALPVHVLFLTDILFAELPYALITVLFAWCASGRGGRWRFPASATLGAMAFLTRTSGLALLAAWVAESLVRRRWREALLRGAVAALPVLGWQAYTGHIRAGEEYRHPAYEYQRAPYLYYNVGYAENASLLAPFTPELGRATPADLARRFAGNVASAPAMLGRALFSGRGGHDASPGRLTGPLHTLAGLAILAGLVALARRDPFPPLYVLASVALICTTPWPSQFGRYLAPLAPFLALAVVVPLREAAGRLPRSGRDATHPARSALVLVVALTMIAKQAYSAVRVDGDRAGPSRVAAHGLPEARYFFYDPRWASFEAALRWLGSHAGPGEVVASAAPQQAYLRSGLEAVMFPMEPDPREARRLLDGVPARYLVLDHLDIQGITARYAEPVVREDPDAWELVYTCPEGLTSIYRRR